MSGDLRAESVRPLARSLVVSIHDVSPHTRAATTRLLSHLKSVGVDRSSLLVVPNYHHHGHFLEDGEFRKWLTALALEGHEVVAHGYFHQRERQTGESLRAKLTTRFYTKDEGEFFDLRETEALTLLWKAKSEFAEAGWRPSGFIAPAWLLGTGAERAARSAGFQYTTRLGHVSRLDGSATWPSQSLVWSVRSGWRRAMSLVWNGLLFHRLRDNPLMRIGVHPPDLTHPVILGQILELTRRGLADRRAATYEEWVARASR